MGVADNMPEQTLVTWIRVDSPNEFDIDFYIVRRKINHAGKIRVIGSEIVDRDFTSERLEFMGNSDHEFAFRGIYAFEDFENDFRRTDIERTKRFPYEIHERKVGYVIRRYVNGKLGFRLSEMGESLFDHDAGYGSEVSAFLRGGEEFARSEHRNGIGGIVHANETFDLFLGGSESGVVVDFLIERHEKILFECVLHKGNHLEAFTEICARMMGRIEEHGRFATFSRLMEGHVRAHEHFSPHRSVRYDSNGKQEGDSRIFMDNLQFAQMREELFDGIGSRAFRTHDGEIGAFQFVRFPALAPKQPRKSSSYRDKNVVPHFWSVGVVHFYHVIHVHDRQRGERVRFQILHELVSIRESGLKIDHRSGAGMCVTEAFELGDIVADHLERNDYAVLHYGGDNRMKPK